MEETLKGKEFNEMPKMLEKKDSNIPIPVIMPNKKLRNIPSLLKKLDPNEMEEMLNNNEKTETDTFKKYYKDEAERASAITNIFNKKLTIIQKYRAMKTK